ncbi:apolipoprotein N-acyltransferase [Actomonas aquatica]|uniref:Apolipoprotein N-acyltransferase n=1 Tax=Actomonas aquatica TaxID=2866162 RepID=A0ABZ1C5Y7_9BACT|nr:apolipoprotein N-acyltransferase [Opitutus sp. WL0086]WRQ87148.1 apolipoprotein N-acyltransferase [Opitutus sp. WL0086]
MNTAKPDIPLFPEYDNPTPPFWEQHGGWLAPAAVFVLTVLFTVVAFPPFQVPEAAYACLAPAILWAYRRPSFRLFALVTIGAQVTAWYILLWWLHHATWAGWALLAPVVGVWVGAWYLAVWWMMPRLRGQATIVRVLGVLGLAGLWVIIEWSRTWLLTGFPWLPLAASQWERSSILQIAAYAGAGGVSFVLVLMNLGFAAYGHRLFFEKHLRGLKKRSQEFFVAVFGLLVCLSVHVSESVNRHYFNQDVGRIGFVQPDVPQELKWDASQGPAIVNTLQQATATVARRNADLILWPEAVTPWAVRGDATVKAFVEEVARESHAPLLLGSIAVEGREVGEGDPEDGVWYNGAFMVDPQRGVDYDYYRKRHLVPFGEYVPMRSALGWLDKVVPLPGDFEEGSSPQPLLFNANGVTLSVGPLICYEDTYPQLARDSVKANVDLLVVLTNNGWFGRGGAAEQHAAHSVLRAVETRRPVLRIGNAGWSGWIDEFGVTRAVLRKVMRRQADGTYRPMVSTKIDEEVEGSIYFRGSAVVDVQRDVRWIGKQSFYVQHGDWFVLVALGLFTMAVMVVRNKVPDEPEPESDTSLLDDVHLLDAEKIAPRSSGTPQSPRAPEKPAEGDEGEIEKDKDKE